MSLAKRCIEILAYGDVESRYQAARYMILRSAHFQMKQGRKSKDVIGKLIHDYCLRYGLRKRKLGQMISEVR